jgi:SOS-response transcriptional repressor LexA
MSMKKLPNGGTPAAREIGERLGKLLKIMRLKNYQFSEKFGISNASLARYKSGDRLPEPQLLLDLCKARVNINWLLTGEGTTQITQDFDGWMKEKLEQRMKVVDSKTGLIQSPTIDYTRTITLPIVGEISAGPREDVIDCRSLGETVEVPRTLAPGNDNNYIAFRVNGHSMEPNILHEDIVIIKQSIDWDNANGKVCAVRATDGVTLKKVVLDPANSRIILQPFNMDYNVQIIDPDQGLELILIGNLSLQMRLFKID